MKYTKDQLSEEVSLAFNNQITKNDIKESITIIFDFISESLKENNRVELRGFGSLSLRSRNVPLDPRSNSRENKNRVLCNSVYYRMSKAVEDKLKDN